jgi:hypothetical protein
MDIFYRRPRHVCGARARDGLFALAVAWRRPVRSCAQRCILRLASTPPELDPGSRNQGMDVRTCRHFRPWCVRSADRTRSILTWRNAT